MTAKAMRSLRRAASDVSVYIARRRIRVGNTDSRHIKRRLHGALFLTDWNLANSTDIVKGEATVDVLGMCFIRIPFVAVEG